MSMKMILVGSMAMPHYAMKFGILSALASETEMEHAFESWNGHLWWSLGGVITAVSILVPEEFFDVDVERADGQAPVFLRKGSEDGSVLSAIIAEQSDPERHALMSAIKLCELAR